MLDQIKFNLYENLYKDLPKDTFSQKIIKIRKIHELDEKEGICRNYWFSVQDQELNNIYSKPNTLKDIGDKFNINLKYFGDYYYCVFINPYKRFVL